ncbi:MAG: MerR family transcriptional regulator [Novosphingobium sp.]|nr:MerR family transcriptional regulator [Novosphingobium sp.]
MTIEQGLFPGFDDGKAPEAMRTIGEVAKALRIRQHVLRYWEEQFPMLQPVKRSGGRRYYRPDDVRLVATINRLVHQEGYTIRGARTVLEGGSVSEIAGGAKANASAPDTVALQAIRDELAAALDES